MNRRRFLSTLTALGLAPKPRAQRLFLVAFLSLPLSAQTEIDIPRDQSMAIAVKALHIAGWRAGDCFVLDDTTMMSFPCPEWHAQALKNRKDHPEWYKWEKK